MASSDNSLRYSDERDKAYGLTGMAITLVASDGPELLSAISLDGDSESDFEMTHEFFFRGNPRMAAKYLWITGVRHLNLASRMILGNAMCREYVLRGQRELTDNRRATIRDIVREVAIENCALAEDEAQALFDDSFRYVHRLFSHIGVHSVADHFADELRQRREMSAAEVVELLSQLGLR
ncbi:MAG: hypothetical protein K2M06_00715 [Muribaculaceae bacterium]|nr:hypothetical protein [Muribaculaceae bacterium]